MTETQKRTNAQSNIALKEHPCFSARIDCSLKIRCVYYNVTTLAVIKSLDFGMEFFKKGFKYYTHWWKSGWGLTGTYNLPDYEFDI